MRIILSFISLFVSLLAFPALSAWQIDNANSALSFVTIKKEDVAEAHKFNALNGSLDESGKVQFMIDLSSVNTNVPIRDQRMQEFLFNTKLFPKAQFDSQLDMAQFNSILIGHSALMKLTGEISLHDQKQKVTIAVLVAKLSNASFIVSSMQPVLINAEHFGLTDGVKKLQELAGLPSISNAVSVNFVLSFTQ